MFIEERYKYILDLLDKNGKVLVKDLSSTFNVSESMIRKDLKILEKRKLLQRTYGGAITISHSLISVESFHSRIDQYADLKDQIASKACDKITEQDTIFLDASTTSYMIVRQLIAQNQKLTLITNMVEISSLIPAHSNIQFIFIGGDYNPFVGGSIGSYAIEQIKGYHCTKAFIGCCGVDLQNGNVISSSSEDASTKKAVMSISNELYLVMTNENFKKAGSHNFANIVDFNGIITDSQPDASILSRLKEYDISIS